MQYVTIDYGLKLIQEINKDMNTIIKGMKVREAIKTIFKETAAGLFERSFLVFFGLIICTAIFLITVTADAASPAGPAINGETGIINVVSAESLPAGAIMLGVNGLYFYSKDLLNTAGDVNERFEGNVNATYGATNWLEVYLNESNFAHTIVNGSNGKDNIYQMFGDLTGGFKVSHPLSDGFFIGIDAFAQLHTNSGVFGYKLNATNFGARILGTKELDVIKNVPIVFDLNLGYKWDNSRYLMPAPNYTIGPYTTASDLYAAGFPYNEIEYALGVYHSNQVLGAAGLEIPLALITPFIQYYTNQVINTGGSGPSLHYDQSPQFIIPGVRFTPVKRLTIDLAAEIGLTKVEPVNVPGSSGVTRNVRGIPLWTAVIGASYTILPGENAVTRRKAPQFVGLTGTVSDTAGNPLAAVISFNNMAIPPVGTEPVTGIYSAKLPPGNYEVTASAQGFTSQTINVEVRNNEKTVTSFTLEQNLAAAPQAAAVTENKPSPVLEKAISRITIRAQSIHFETGSAEILPVFYPILNDLVTLLKENPSIHIVIEGNTDNTGTAAFNEKLSVSRADSVMKYLIQHGINPDRLKAKGYGEAQPVEPNTTSGARAINRRVNIQFTIE
ncbi:MAG: OmpA family protein [Deltaproteobacteria bacterium]|nr:OmpA family protein [Deltaproteobacteria bacterium]